jgi:hypothetical protein
VPAGQASIALNDPYQFDSAATFGICAGGDGVAARPALSRTSTHLTDWLQPLLDFQPLDAFDIPSHTRTKPL